MKRIVLYLASVALPLLIALFLFLLPAYSQGEVGTPVPAVEPTPTAPTGSDELQAPDPTEEPQALRTHIVQAGETLIAIAEQYSTTVELLAQLNGITDPTTLQEGQQLLIPGGEGVLFATVHTIGLGDSLRGIAATYSTTVEALAGLNRMVHPGYLPAGVPLTVLGQTGDLGSGSATGRIHLAGPGDSALSIATQYGVSPLAVIEANNLAYPAYLFPGQRLRLPGDGRFQFLPASWKRVALQPLPLVRGQTAAVYVENLFPGIPAGEFVGQAIHFFPRGDGYIGLVGVDAFVEPGRYPLTLTGEGNRPWPPFEQDVAIEAGSYGTQYIQIPEELSYLLEPGIREAEDALLASVYNQVSSGPLWQGPFQLPVVGSSVTASYGDARSYNGGPIEIYHTGIDFAGTIGTLILSPADGIVVFSDTLSIRGKTLIVDHGMGVMSGYYHLSEITTSVGERVSAGQPIAQGGSTGLSTGPHLHWDVRVANVPVNGLQWVEQDVLAAGP